MKKIIVLLSLAVMPPALASCTTIIQQGPNRLQPAPALSSAVKVNGVITVSGMLTTIKKNATFIVQFFGNPTNRNPITEGLDFLGQTIVTTDCNGIAAFSAVLPVTQNTDGFISATATLVNVDGTVSDTSMFSLNIPIA